MIVVNADNGHIIANLPIGKGVDGADFDPNTKLAFSSNGDGTLTVIHEDSPDKFSVVENATTQRARERWRWMRKHTTYFSSRRSLARRLRRHLNARVHVRALCREHFLCW
jgi:hypothetical protein